MPNDELFAVEFLIDTTLPDGSKYSAGARTILPAYEARTRAGAGIPDLKILGYAAEFPTIQPPAAARRKTSPVLFANLPAASAANDGDEVDVTDLNGGTRFRSNGVAWVQVSPGVTENAVTYSTWADRNQGTPYLGQRKMFTDIGNQPVPAEYNGTRWVPVGGMAKIYRQAGVVNGTAGASSTATSALVTLPGDLLGPEGGWVMEAAFSASASPTAATPAAAWDGSATFDGVSVGTKRNVRIRRSCRNVGSDASQIINEAQGDLGGPGTGSGAVQTFTKNTANDRTLQVSCVFTHASSIVATLHSFDVWWVA